MRLMRATTVLLAASALASCASTSEQADAEPVRPAAASPATAASDENAPTCSLMPDRHRLFIAEFHRLWALTLKNDLGTESTTLPWGIFVSETCAFHVEATAPVDGAHEISTPLSWAQKPLSVQGVAHGGKVTLPDGNEVPAGPMAFASFGEKTPAYFVMGLMDLWAKHPKAGAMKNAAALILTVGLHEHAHTIQLAALQRRAREVLTGAPQNMQVNEKVLESPFKGNDVYQSGMRAEIDALWTAALARDDASAKPAFADALRLRTARHKKWFIGERAWFAQMEGALWNMEGVGEWVRIRTLTDSTRLVENEALVAAEPLFDGWAGYRDVHADVTIANIRQQTRREFAQEAGLALMILVSRYVPNWRKSILGESPADPYLLLATHWALPGGQ